MKKFLLGLTLCLSLGFYGCGSDDNGGSAANPSDVDFSSPTGTLSEDNADDVGNQAVNSFTPGGNPTGLSESALVSPTIQQQGSNCFDGFSQGDTSGNVDLNCLLDYDNCTFDDGQGDYSYDQDSTSFSIGWSDQTLTCDEYTYENYNSEYSFSNSGVYCFANSFTYDGEDISSNYCYNTQGQFVIIVNGDTYAMGSTSGNCADGVTMEITDSEGTSTISCDAVSPSSCSSFYQVTAVENCEISTN